MLDARPRPFDLEGTPSPHRDHRVALHLVDRRHHEALDHHDAVGAAVLDEHERNRAQRFRRRHDRHLYVTAHVALRVILGQRMAVAPGEVEFRRLPCTGCGGEHGRPVVVDGPEFSLSHSGDLVLVGVDEHPLGVDIEVVPPAGVVEDAGAALHPTERGELERSPAEERPRRFVRAWVRKEALLKGMGVGLNRPLDRDYVGTGPEPAPGPGEWSLRDLTVPDGYAAAVATRPRGLLMQARRSARPSRR